MRRGLSHARGAEAVMNYYPIYIDISGKLVTVVGGGEVALRKVQDLLAAGAVIRVISPEFHDGFSGLISSRDGRIE
ncbi:MAG TPA: NAD(P)-dependent oxidoreductase, partial [Spirochaetota bacterium]|nr:NAD(P)-dependent oxidoreductase [Spirochaetota bacterium]